MQADPIRVDQAKFGQAVGEPRADD